MTQNVIPKVPYSTINYTQSQQKKQESKRIFEDDICRECLYQMSQNGLALDGQIVADGKIQRYSIDQKKNQPDEWYIAWLGTSTRGNSYLSCTYGSWSTGKRHKFNSWEHNESISQFDEKEKNALRESMENRWAEIEKKLKEKREQAAKSANEIWEASSKTHHSENHLLYLKKKKVGPVGVRFGKNSHGFDSIIIPLRNISGEVRSLQYIFASDDGRFHKRFLSGGEKKGNFFQIGQISNGEGFYVVEGYATGVSVYEATKATVMVAFDSGNIPGVIHELRGKYPNNKITIAADNDETGLKKAKNSADSYGCSVVYPKFPQGKELDGSGDRYTDFNDLQDVCGIEELRKQLQQPLEPKIFEPYSLNDLLHMPEKKWLINQVIGEKDIGMIYGAPGSGKTFVAIDMIISACIGGPWADRFKIIRPLNVAYCAGEGLGGLKSRFQAAVNRYKIKTDLSNFTFFKTMPQLFPSNGNSESVDSIEKFVFGWKHRQQQGNSKPLDIIFLDTLHTATISADENSAKDMGKVLHLCRWAARELECAVIFVHHSNKGATAERGSSSIRGAMDVMIEVKKSTEIKQPATIECSKLKDGEGWGKQSFTLDPVERTDSVCVSWKSPNDSSQGKGAMQNHSEKILSIMEEHQETKFTVKSLAEVIGESDAYTRKLLSIMVKDKLCVRVLQDEKKESSSRNPWLYWIY